jgi:hypothetical protein
MLFDDQTRQIFPVSFTRSVVSLTRNRPLAGQLVKRRRRLLPMLTVDPERSSIAVGFAALEPELSPTYASTQRSPDQASGKQDDR